MSTERHEVVDPADPRALAAVGEYLLEVDATFDGRFDPGPQDLQAMRPPTGAFLIVTDGARVIGCAGLRTIAPGTCEVKRMWIAPDARGTGAGRRLLAGLERYAADLGAEHVRLDTSDVLHAALGLYRSSGYVEIERYNDNPHARVWFDKTL